MSIRQQYERTEAAILGKLAILSAETRGRERPVTPCDIRTDFQRDRDRILHCKSFRRLMHKTQVFLLPEGDHYRTRLTHTLEVCQIARTIARALRLSEDLTEAIALGHDLGHTPFGHAGEAVLARVCPHGYRHEEQSVRVVEVLENAGKGLNLTWEVRDGIRHHSHDSGPAATSEGQVVRFADKIAYMNHDIEDAVRAGVLGEEDVPWEVRHGLGRSKSERITTLVRAVVENSTDAVLMGEKELRLYHQLRRFLFEAVYTNPAVKGEEDKAKGMVEQLYHYYTGNPDKLPGEYRRILEQEDVHRAVCDYISGMSDRYCIACYKEAFLPQSWRVE